MRAWTCLDNLGYGVLMSFYSTSEVEVPLNDTLSLFVCQVPGAANRFQEMMRRLDPNWTVVPQHDLLVLSKSCYMMSKMMVNVKWFTMLVLFSFFPCDLPTPSYMQTDGNKTKKHNGKRGGSREVTEENRLILEAGDTIWPASVIMVSWSQKFRCLDHWLMGRFWWITG